MAGMGWMDGRLVGQSVEWKGTSTALHTRTSICVIDHFGSRLKDSPYAYVPVPPLGTCHVMSITS